MLAQRALSTAARFTRRDAVRLAIAASLLVAVLTAILSVDILPPGVAAGEGDVARVAVIAPRSAEFESAIRTQAAREQAAQAVAPQYTYTPDDGDLAAARQVAALDRLLEPVDAAFNAVLSDQARRQALAAALPKLSKTALATLQDLDRAEWLALRAEMRRVLDSAQRREVRDTALEAARAAFPQLMDQAFAPDERALAGEILAPLLVANSSYDAAATEAARQQAAAAVAPVRVSVKQGEVIVDAGHRITDLDLETMKALGLLDPRPDVAKLGGWFVLSLLAVGLLLAWFWRFRPAYWHRDNALMLVGLLLVLATVAVKLTVGRPLLPFVVPVAAVGLLLAILLDGGVAVVVSAMIAVIAGAAGGSSTELAAYVFLGSLAGAITIGRGDRLGSFVQASASMALANAAAVTIFTFLGERDLTGLLQLLGASVGNAAIGGVVAVGSFAVLGNLFGITTSFHLLELANPSQPLLRRLLLETPGTYHHSLMVGNLAERAAEAIGADALLVRVAAYYHDIGKLANPLAFIENQAGDVNVHDYLTPEESAVLLREHVSNGIDMAYEYKLPKAIIAMIPQHHGTTLMSYFYARAQEQAIAEAGARPGSPEASAAAAQVDAARFRHMGPRPQTREAAVLMLADGVEASVRSLTGHDEAAIRAMVDAIVRERLDDGQFDECDLTLRDLDKIRNAFVAQLLGMYHQRVEYPQNRIVEIESRRAAGGGRG
jgi:putative nucleotidyltransferase with HDIG domain